MLARLNGKFGNTDTSDPRTHFGSANLYRSIRTLVIFNLAYNYGRWSECPDDWSVLRHFGIEYEVSHESVWDRGVLGPKYPGSVESDNRKFGFGASWLYPGCRRGPCGSSDFISNLGVKRCSAPSEGLQFGTFRQFWGNVRAESARAGACMGAWRRFWCRILASERASEATQRSIDGTATIPSSTTKAH